MRKIDITGQRFGRLTVTAEALPRRKPNGELRCYWRCRCDCGVELEAMLTNLKQRPDPSCGCLKTEKLVVKNFRHGLTPRSQKLERLYSIWAGMRKRCRNPKDSAFEDYGGRGISVDPIWHDYVPFKAWAVVNGYADHLSIERIDNDGNYTPENCCWIPLAQQAFNRRPRKNRSATCGI